MTASASSAEGDGVRVGSAPSEPGGERVGARRRRARATLFTQEADRLVALARFFTDDRTAAEDLVQEAFIRLARNAHRIRDQDKAAAYLRSIVINLARDHNRRGLVSLRTGRRRCSTSPRPRTRPSSEESRREVVAPCGRCRTASASAVDCATTSSSPSTRSPTPSGSRANSVKTHLKGACGPPPWSPEKDAMADLRDPAARRPGRAPARIPSPDLFARVVDSIAEDRCGAAILRARRRAVGGRRGAARPADCHPDPEGRGGNAHALVDPGALPRTSCSSRIALWLGPFIKRFGRAYAADVFHDNPLTGKSYIVLTDIVYYLIFAAYILFTIRVDAPVD